MRKVLSVLILTILGVGVSAQTPTKPSDVEKLKSWKQTLDALSADIDTAITTAQTPDVPPVPPVVIPDVGTVTVRPVKDVEGFLAALDAAVPGDTIAVAPGNYTGSFVLPAKASNPLKKYITITTQGVTLPSSRVAFSRKAQLANFYGVSNTFVFQFAQRSSYYRLVGLAFNSTAAAMGEMIRIGDSEDANLANVPHHIDIDRNIFLGGSNGQKRGIAANGSDLNITRNYCGNIYGNGQDSQCVAMWSTPGRIVIRDNYLESASEPILIGGTPPAGPGLVPDYVMVERNTITHKAAWKTDSSKPVKNLFEIKFGKHITVRENTLYGHWPGGQPGYAIVFTVAVNTDRPGGCPECVMEDVLFERNIVKDVSAGININGHDYANASGAMKRLTVRNNLFLINATKNGGNGLFMLISSEPEEVIVENNTVVTDGYSFVSGYYGDKFLPGATKAVTAGPIKGFVFRNNIVTSQEYGIFTPEGTQGRNILTFFPGIVLENNLIFDNPDTAKYPGTNYVVPRATLTTVLDSTKNYMLKTGSLYAGIGADPALLPK